MWEYNFKCVRKFFGKNRDHYGITQLRGIPGQCKVITCVDPRQKSNKLRLRGWPGLTRTTERKLFSNPQTVLYCAKHRYAVTTRLTYQTICRYVATATWQSRVHRYSANTSTEYQPIVQTKGCTNYTRSKNEGKNNWCFINFSQLILLRNGWRSVLKICQWILGLKGLSQHYKN